MKTYTFIFNDDQEALFESLRAVLAKTAYRHRVSVGEVVFHAIHALEHTLKPKTSETARSTKPK